MGVQQLALPAGEKGLVVQILQVSSCSCSEELIGMGQSGCSWDSAAAPSLVQSQSSKTSLHLFLQALQGDIKHSQAVVTFELLSQCSAFLQVCWGVRHPQPSRDGDISASGAKFCVDPPCCLCSNLVCWNKGTQTENNTAFFAVQGQLLELIAAGCQQDKIQQDSRED